MMTITNTVKQLLIINIMMFVATLLMEAPGIPETLMSKLFALHFPLDSDFYLWQLVTHMFMHGDFMHIFFNMFALVMFGSLLEQYWGARKFLFFYFSCGIGAAALQLGVNYFEYVQEFNLALQSGISSDVIDTVVRIKGPESGKSEYIKSMLMDGTMTIDQARALVPVIQEANSVMVGASGAIYGLLVAFAFMFPMAELAMLFLPIPVKAKYFVPGILVIDLILGFTGSSVFGDNSGGGGVAHFAHVGGAIVGFIMMWMWKRNSFNDRRWN